MNKATGLEAFRHLKKDPSLRLGMTGSPRLQDNFRLPDLHLYLRRRWYKNGQIWIDLRQRNATWQGFRNIRTS